MNTLIDAIDNINIHLFSEPEYREYLGTDELMAAILIQKFAADANIASVANSKLATIVRTLHIVLRRYNL